VNATTHCNLRKTGEFIPPAHIGHGRYNVQNEEEMLDAAESNPQTTSCWDAYETGLSWSAVWHTMHEEHLYPFQVQHAKGLQKGTIIFTSSSVDGFYIKL
jgi:hypothetical protein